MQTFRKLTIVLLCTLSIWGLSACREDKNSKTGRLGNAPGRGALHATLQPDSRFFDFRDNGQGHSILEENFGHGDGPAPLHLLPLPPPSPFPANEDAKPLYGGIPAGKDLDPPVATPVPEPPTSMLLALGFGAVAVAIQCGGKGKRTKASASHPSVQPESRKKHPAS